MAKKKADQLYKELAKLLISAADQLNIAKAQAALINSYAAKPKNLPKKQQAFSERCIHCPNKFECSLTGYPTERREKLCVVGRLPLEYAKGWNGKKSYSIIIPEAPADWNNMLKGFINNHKQ